MSSSTFSYRLLPWGDLIGGTRQELQDLGLAVGQAFPGETGGPKRRLKIIDPRGFPGKIDRWQIDAGVYLCSISFPDRRAAYDGLIPSPEVIAPGVVKRTCIWWDEFVGTAEALIAAGLVAETQLPGQPGRPKVSVSLSADGTRIGGPGSPPWAKRIQKDPRHKFTVQVSISEHEGECRRDEIHRSEDALEALLATWPRPAPLVVKARDEAARQRRAEMRLVWSKPPWQPRFIVPDAPPPFVR